MPYTSFEFIDTIQLNNFDNDELIQYIDRFLSHREYEESLKYNWPFINFWPRLSEFQTTNFYKSIDNLELQRKIILKFFDFILHMQYILIHPSWANVFVYSSNIYKIIEDKSPSIQIMHAHFNQMCIISARNSLEILMHTIHLLEFGVSIPNTKKSKIQVFIKNIIEKKTKWIYFTPHFIDIVSLTRSLRDPEVHAWSPFPKKVLTWKLNWDLSNQYMLLWNILRSTWKPIIEIIDNKQKVYNISIYNHQEDGWKKYEEFHTAYLSNDQLVIDQYIQRLIDVSRHN